MRTPDFGTNKELAQGYTARKWQSWDSTPRCDPQFLGLLVLFDDHFLTSDDEAWAGLWGIQLCMRSLFADLSLLGEMGV